MPQETLAACVNALAGPQPARFCGCATREDVDRTRHRLLRDHRLVSQLGIRLDHAPDSATVLRLARTHDLTLYDALYLELAIRETRPLATLDRRLATAFRAENSADTRPKA